MTRPKRVITACSCGSTITTQLRPSRINTPYATSGAIARGGLRWSDRPADFRTEVLGLAKAQQVENAVIVPVGAKGGFVVKQPQSAGDRDAAFEEGVQCYQTMIRGMLDITEMNRVTVE